MDQISNNIEELLPYILNLSFIFPFIAFFLRFKRIAINAKVLLLLVYSTIFFILNQFFNEIYWFLGRKNYYFIYTVFEYFIFGFLILLNIQSKKFRPFFYIISGVFLIILLIIYLISNIKRVDSISIGIEFIMLIIFILYFFFDQLKNVSTQSIYELFGFWIVLGILIYLGFTFFFNMLANYLSKELVDQYELYTYVGDIIRNTLFAVAIFMLEKDNKIKQNPIPKLDMI